MKKITLSVIALAAISFASCKKDRTCTCTSTETYGGITYTSMSVTKAKSSKKDAENWCTANQSAVYSDGSGGSTTATGYSCKIN